MRRKAAGNPRTPPETLAELVGDPQWHVRFAIAGNFHTPAEALPTLAEDERWEVRRAVASRWPIPAGLLDRLARDPYREVRATVASRPAPPQALQALAADPFRQVRREVAANPHTPPHVLAQLAADNTEGAPTSDDPHLAGTSPLQAQLTNLSETWKETVRQRVARHPSAPADVLTTPLGDDDPKVRGNATARLIWRNLTHRLREIIPAGLVLAERPPIQRDEWQRLVPDLVIAEEGAIPNDNTTTLDPAAVKLAVTATWPWPSGTPASPPDATAYMHSGITWLWQVHLNADPVITVLHLQAGDEPSQQPPQPPNRTRRAPLSAPGAPRTRLAHCREERS